MRQVGLLAAAADYAIKNHWPLMQDDHRRAKELAEIIAQRSDMEIDPKTVESNIVIFELKHETASDFLKRMDAKGIRMVPFGPQKVRAVYHFQVDETMHQQVLQVFKN
jgi:threonine aldolase